MIEKKGFDLHDISKYRDQIFGIAIISIIIFHFSADFSDSIGQDIGIGAGLKNDIIMTYFKYIRSIGVEVFTFLSGVGLYYSYNSNSDNRLFYKKRAKRLLIPYLIVAIVFWTIKDFYFLGEGLKKFIGDITFVTLITRGVHTIWFIGLMAFLYIVFPMIYKAMNESKYRYLGFAITMSIAVLFPVAIRLMSAEIYDNMSIAITRIPIFIFGVFCGKEIKNGTVINGLLSTFIIIFGLVVKYVNVQSDFPSFVSRYLDAIYACSLILLCVYVLKLLRNVNWLNIFLKQAGKYSLELYMVHVTMRNLLKEFGFHTYRISVYVIMIAVAIVISVLLNRISNIITNKLFH